VCVSRARRAAARRREGAMSSEPAVGGGGAAGGGEAEGIPPNVTIYINNLNEKIKLEGVAPLSSTSLTFPYPSLNPRDLRGSCFPAICAPSYVGLYAAACGLICPSTQAEVPFWLWCGLLLIDEWEL
jgi:hypothetical protein